MQGGAEIKELWDDTVSQVFSEEFLKRIWAESDTKQKGTLVIEDEQESMSQAKTDKLIEEAEEAIKLCQKTKQEQEQNHELVKTLQHDKQALEEENKILRQENEILKQAVSGLPKKESDHVIGKVVTLLVGETTELTKVSTSIIKTYKEVNQFLKEKIDQLESEKQILEAKLIFAQGRGSAFTPRYDAQEKASEITFLSVVSNTPTQEPENNKNEGPYCMWYW